MKSLQDLARLLDRLDGKGYKAYKDLQGQYQGRDFVLSVDHVQGDPFASPSRIRVTVPGDKAGFPAELYDTPYKRRAVTDFLSRIVADNIRRYYRPPAGSGHSGLLTVGCCGQEILERNFIIIDRERVEARLEVGLPAAGRTILGRAAQVIFLQALPQIVAASLFYTAIPRDRLIGWVQLVEDQHCLRRELVARRLVAFVANGSILPRESGVSPRPMPGAVPFQSPAEYEVELTLPNRGVVRGMGIPEGVTLIVGGGFHGKSTLLRALELGVYDHIAGDGREYLVTRDNAVKIRAEDGRNVTKVNISPFINNLPLGQDTTGFSTNNASGSTSQAANIMEALEIGTELLLIDEDTSATNFMIRDGRMQRLVQKDKEPITPFIDLVRTLYEEHRVSTVLVVGGAGDYFDVADHVIMMDEYLPRDVTGKAREIVRELPCRRETEAQPGTLRISPRVVLRSSFSGGQREVRIKPRGIHQIACLDSNIDLRDLEQLIDPSQTNAICLMLRYIMERVADDRLTLPEIVDRVYNEAVAGGLDVLSPWRGHPGNLALPRKYEIAGALNRFRNLKIR